MCCFVLSEVSVNLSIPVSLSVHIEADNVTGFEMLAEFAEPDTVSKECV